MQGGGGGWVQRDRGVVGMGLDVCVWFGLFSGMGEGGWRGRLVGAPVAGVAVAAAPAWPDLVMTRCVARSLAYVLL